MDWLGGLSDPHTGIAAARAPDTTKRVGTKKTDGEGPEVGSETLWVPFSEANKGETEMISDLRGSGALSIIYYYYRHGILMATVMGTSGERVQPLKDGP